MTLKTLVKISSVNNLTDARYGAGMGVTWLGFQVVDSQPNYISPESYSEITEWIAGVDYVLEFENCSLSYIQEKLKLYKKAVFLQLSDITLAEQIHSVTQLPIILNMPDKWFNNIGKLKSLANRVTFFQLRYKEVLLMSEKERDLIKEFISTHQVLAEITNIDVKKLDFLEHYGFKGVSVKGENEIRAGYKDFDSLGEILEALEELD